MLAVRPLDEFTLFYHRPAGATHLLSEPAPEIVAALQAGPADADALLVRLADRFDLGDDARAGLLAHLDELIAAGLVTTT